MISTTKCLRPLFLFAGLFLMAMPLQTLAAVQITEVMYNAPGADQGHEWIEVTDTGSEPANLAGWKFFQGGTNHGLSVAQGTTTLLAGESAIISNNPVAFLGDFPKYSGTIFKSSFSLNNSGETIALKDAKLNSIDSLSYSSSLGGNGDGNTLHLAANGLVAGAPDPGVYTLVPPKPLAKPAAIATPATSKSLSKSKSSSSKSFIPASTDDSAAAFQATTELPAPAQTPALWYALGLASLLMLGAAGGLYARLAVPRSAETSSGANEFDIE